MKKLMTFAAFTFASALPAMAQSSSAPATLVPPVFALGLAAGLAALGQGRAVAAAAEGMARNPGAAGAIRGLVFIGLVFMESLVLFTFVKS
jgi:F-type H+-transporting ATPase subunit c